MPTQARKDIPTDELFNQYIEVVNRVIAENRDGLYGKSANLWSKKFADEPIAVGVYDRDADTPHHWYTLKLRDSQLTLVDRIKDPDAKIKWKVKEDHLNHTINNADEYVKNPMKLDLDWIKTRVGF